ncbi:MAG: PepSY domain-containing protein [Aquabacterium sp.]|uniref:PepSY domain-containing protein n=1 Tax=Aquabacterium sp. TaxID=1872578 RepID=UPI0025C06DD9|nr:PepSY domain-containing protein [Aquabacterium sp.]MBI3383401.1 PepSY domain-containing protein [Aquabacterium sp.]
MYRYTRVGLLATVIIATGVTALAAKASNDNDAKHIPQAAVTLGQAVAAAEQHVHGRAVRAEFERARQGWVYDIEVIQGSKVFDIKVDAEKASVLSAVEDRVDRDDDHDKQD